MVSDFSTWHRESVTEHLYQESRVSSILYRGQSRFQRIELLETYPFGRTLVLDGRTQSTELDEFIYHELLVHPAMLTHPSPRRVLIAGGGEGATLREVLAHNTVQEAVMVDIDEEVVTLSRRYLPEWHQGAFDDPRARVLFQDAREYIKGSDSRFDVVIVDLSDPQEGTPSALLFTREFYRLVLKRLAPDGVLSLQAQCTDYGNTYAFTAICHTLRQVFPKVYPYHHLIPSFAGDWGFALVTRSQDPSRMSPESVDESIAARITKPLRAYDGLTHQAVFSLPKVLREALQSETRVLTEKDLLVVL